MVQIIIGTFLAVVNALLTKKLLVTIAVEALKKLVKRSSTDFDDKALAICIEELKKAKLL